MEGKPDARPPRPGPPWPRTRSSPRRSDASAVGGKVAVPLAVVSPGLKPFQDPVPPRPDVVSIEIVVIPSSTHASAKTKK
jgi:hypothetical protein